MGPSTQVVGLGWVLRNSQLIAFGTSSPDIGVFGPLGEQLVPATKATVQKDRKVHQAVALDLDDDKCVTQQKCPKPKTICKEEGARRPAQFSPSPLEPG